MLIRRLLVAIFLSSVLAACSSNKLVKTYEGDALPTKDVATLEAGENISIVTVNGERVPDYLLSNISVNYGLKPGQNVIVFQYESIWGKAKKGKEGARSEVVESKLREVVINAKAGAKYSFRYENAGNLKDARLLAEGFEADIVNQKGKVLASSQDVQDRSAKSEQVAVSLGTDTSRAEGLPAIEAIKVLWEDLSAEEKKSFLKWAFQ